MNSNRGSKTISTILVVCVISILSRNISAQVNFTAPELIGRVSDGSITINVETDGALDYYYEYGSETGVYSDRIPTSGSLTSIANEPFEITINGLTANSKYYYRLVYSSDNGNSWIERDEHSFHTQRSIESNFIFTVTSDSHIGVGAGGAILNLYQRALLNVMSDNPDLHFDLGDAFAMTNVSLGDINAVSQEYLFQRSNMGLISHSSPVFLIIGNHEDEEGWNLDDAGNNVASTRPIMSTNARKKYFLNPIPNGFYSGNSNNSQLEIDDDHLRENYFAFKWGNALFVGIDPYWNTLTKPFAGTAGGEEDDEVVGDRWDWTLGEDQYLWLKQILESSNAKWKFVFAHQVAGGTSDYGRGGAEATNDYEWGADEIDFSLNRPGWTYNTSIHQLMVDNNVTVFFHGHDHVFAKEEIDNMIYQECPQPSDISYGGGFGNYQNSETTVVINNSGHIRVSVSPEEVTVDYIRAYLPAAGTNGTLAYSYNIEPVTSVDNPHSQILDHFALNQNYPNPFNPTTTINYQLKIKSNVQLIIVDITGREVTTLVNKSQNPGEYSISFNASGLESGIYIYKLKVGSFEQSRKMVVLR